MLPRPTYQQRGARCTAGHQTVRSNSGVHRIYDINENALGEGTFGVVRKTKSRKTGTPCVMKIISKACMEGEILGLLANEIAIQEMCDHPNIARIYESFEDPDEIHMAMEICEGGDVSSYLEECCDGKMSEADARILAQELLQAVFYLHSVQHVAHRDIKPNNLLLKYSGMPMRDQVVKLIDFGFAASFTPGRPSLTEVCGTPAYMAPEMVEQLYNEKCDVWSVGCLLHELIVGDVPFTHPSPQQLLLMAGVRPLRMGGPEWDEVSPEAKDLLHGLIAKRPERRASAGEALRHDWFSPGVAFSSSSSAQGEEPEAAVQGSCGEIGENLRHFSLLSGFQKAALRLAAYRLDDDQVQEHRSAFRALDANGDGRLSREELDGGCPELGLSAKEAQKLFSKLDADGSGSVEYTEFLCAAVNKDTLPDHACWEAFRVCDKDGSGSISPGEASELMGRLSSTSTRSSMQQSLSRSMTAEAHSTRSNSLLDLGELDYEGFVSLLRKSSKSRRPSKSAEVGA